MARARTARRDLNLFPGQSADQPGSSDDFVGIGQVLNGNSERQNDKAPGRFFIPVEYPLNRRTALAAAAAVIGSKGEALAEMTDSQLAARGDLGAMFDAHMRHEFVDMDLDATMKTMTADPYVFHVPTMTGGVGRPLDFIARLAALVPKPRVNLTRFHGVFAPNSRLRSQVTPGRSARLSLA